MSVRGSDSEGAVSWNDRGDRTSAPLWGVVARGVAEREGPLASSRPRWQQRGARPPSPGLQKEKRLVARRPHRHRRYSVSVCVPLYGPPP
jgi:hypothetical protein